jgi:hypothetical protein
LHDDSILAVIAQQLSSRGDCTTAQFSWRVYTTPLSILAAFAPQFSWRLHNISLRSRGDLQLSPRSPPSVARARLGSISRRWRGARALR